MDLWGKPYFGTTPRCCVNAPRLLEDEWTRGWIIWDVTLTRGSDYLRKKCMEKCAFLLSDKMNSGVSIIQINLTIWQMTSPNLAEEVIQSLEHVVCLSVNINQLQWWTAPKTCRIMSSCDVRGFLPNTKVKQEMLGKFPSKSFHTSWPRCIRPNMTLCLLLY